MMFALNVIIKPFPHPLRDFNDIRRLAISQRNRPASSLGAMV